MDEAHIGAQSVRFAAAPSILAFAAVGGKKESEGPLRDAFDRLSVDTTFGETSWEKAESRLQALALETAAGKLGAPVGALDVLFAGDLLNLSYDG